MQISNTIQCSSKINMLENVTVLQGSHFILLLEFCVVQASKGGNTSRRRRGSFKVSAAELPLAQDVINSLPPLGFPGKMKIQIMRRIILEVRNIDPVYFLSVFATTLSKSFLVLTST